MVADISGRNQPAQPKAAGYVKLYRQKISRTNADRPQLKRADKYSHRRRWCHHPGGRSPALARRTDLLVIAREMQRAGAGRVRLPSGC
jgi:hypothetical protein